MAAVKRSSASAEFRSLLMLFSFCSTDEKHADCENVHVVRQTRVNGSEGAFDRTHTHAHTHTDRQTLTRTHTNTHAHTRTHTHTQTGSLRWMGRLDNLRPPVTGSAPGSQPDRSGPAEKCCVSGFVITRDECDPTIRTEMLSAAAPSIRDHDKHVCCFTGVLCLCDERRTDGLSHAADIWFCFVFFCLRFAERFSVFDN